MHSLLPLLARIQTELHLRTVAKTPESASFLGVDASNASLLSSCVPLLRVSFQQPITSAHGDGAAVGDALAAARWFERYSRLWPVSAPTSHVRVSIFFFLSTSSFFSTSLQSRLADGVLTDSHVLIGRRCTPTV